MHKQKGVVEIVLVLLLVAALGLAGYFYLQGRETPVIPPIKDVTNCKTGSITASFKQGTSYKDAIEVLARNNLEPQDKFYSPSIHAFTGLDGEELSLLSERLKQYAEVGNVVIRKDLQADGGLDIYFTSGVTETRARQIESQAGVLAKFPPNVYNSNEVANVRVAIGQEEIVVDRLKTESLIAEAGVVCHTF